MLHHLRLLNPFVRISTLPGANAAARAGAVGAFLAALQVFVGVAIMATMSDVMAQAGQQSILDSPSTSLPAESAALVVDRLPDFFRRLMITMAAIGTVFLTLGIAQWRKRTWAIPLLLAIFAILSALAGLYGLVSLPAEVRPDIGMPLWHTVLNRIASTAELLLFIVGFRGGLFLAKDRKARAVALSA